MCVFAYMYSYCCKMHAHTCIFSKVSLHVFTETKNSRAVSTTGHSLFFITEIIYSMQTRRQNHSPAGLPVGHLVRVLLELCPWLNLCNLANGIILVSPYMYMCIFAFHFDCFACTCIQRSPFLIFIICNQLPYSEENAESSVHMYAWALSLCFYMYVQCACTCTPSLAEYASTKYACTYSYTY